MLIGTLEYRRFEGRELEAPGWRDFFPEPFMTTEEAGELFGVPRAELVMDVSVRTDMMVETESRSLRLAVNSSRITFMLLI